MRLRFVAKTDKDSASLRDGTVDLETGVVGEATGPEVRTQLLFRDRFVAVVRAEHALARGVDLARDGEVTAGTELGHLITHGAAR